MAYRERGPHARGVYPTQDTHTARVKQEEETDTGIMQEGSKKSGRKYLSTKGKNPKQCLKALKT